MRDKVWHINQKTKELTSAYDAKPYATALVSAQPFTVSLKSVMVANDLDGWPRGDNDLLLISQVSLGEAPKVKRVHYYAEEIKPHTVLKDFFGDVMYICDDYSGKERLWLEIRVLEIDTDTGERKVLTNAFSKLAVTAGSVFPVAMPYAALASGVAQATDKLLSALEKNQSAIEVPITLYPSDRPDAGMPLQTGLYGVFGQEVYGEDYQFEKNFTLSRKDGKPVNVAYALFLIEAIKSTSPSYILSQKVATLLTQIDQGNENCAAGALDFLSDTLHNYSNFKDLQRYEDLKSKTSADLTEQEKQLMEQIAKREELKPFIPKT